MSMQGTAEIKVQQEATFFSTEQLVSPNILTLAEKGLF